MHLQKILKFHLRRNVAFQMRVDAMNHSGEFFRGQATSELRRKFAFIFATKSKDGDFANAFEN